MIGACPRAGLALVVSGALLLSVAPVPWVSTASAAVKKKAVKKAPRKKPAPKKAVRAPKKKKKVVVDVPPLPPGRTCYRAPSEVPEPPLLKSAEIELPDTVKGGPLRSALLVYDVTIDKSGHISEVKTVGAPPKEPPWPQLHESAIEALKKYRYAKTVVRRAAAPVCLLVSLNIDLRSEAE